MKYFWITTIYEDGNKWETRCDTFEGMNDIVEEILKEQYLRFKIGDINKEIVKFTVEERTT
tara:strand:- start:385 stop:567 length:183 start_codon:yes stop_codon:yes gene_type:complete